MNSDVIFAEADRFYQIAAHWEANYARTDHADFRRFCSLARKLRFELRQEELLDEQYLARGERVLQRYRFDLSLAPLAFNSRVVDPRLSDAEFEIWLRQTRAGHPQFASLASELVSLLHSLRRDSASPLLDALVNLPVKGETLGVVLNDSRLVEPTLKVVRERLPDVDLHVLSALALRGNSTAFDRIITIGPPNWFPASTFAAPHAATYDVVTYVWQATHWSSEPAFRAGVSARREAIHVATAQIDPDDQPPRVDWQALERQSEHLDRPATDESDFDDIAEARLFTLQGGHGVLLEVGARRSLVIDLEMDDKSRVKRVDANDIEPGMFVLLRTEGGGDYIVPLADQILGENAVTLRHAQAYWKLLLSKLVRRSSLTRVADELSRSGAIRADEGNVRRWMSPRNIRTQDRHDFDAIMHLLGLDADRYWVMMGRIRVAHQQAGHAIQEQLLDQVRQADLTLLNEKGTMDFRLAGTKAGRLTAYRVELSAPETIVVEANRLNRAFRWET
jgi:hypothetical protein